MNSVGFCRQCVFAVAALSLWACTPADKTHPAEHIITPAPVSKNLIHRYSFTNSVKDSAGKVDGILKGGATVTGGKLVLDNGAKLSPDATLAYVDFGSPILPAAGSTSIAFWFTAQDTLSFSRIIDVGDKSGAVAEAFLYFTPHIAAGTTRAAISATNSRARKFVDSPRLDDGKAHVVVLVIDGTAKKMHVYVDGTEPSPPVDLGDNTLDKVRPTHTWVGKSSFDADGGLTASIDELRVYDTALSTEEIAAIIKAGPDALPAGH